MFNFSSVSQLFLFGKEPPRPTFLPKEIVLRSPSKNFRIQYEWKKTKIALENGGDQLLIRGNFLNSKNVFHALKTWLIKQAEQHWIPELESYAKQTGLKYGKVRFKRLSSRWGSCSEKKNINLNIQLLFLPEHLVRQVLLHEICHLQHLNHSRDFWNLVGSFEPNYKIFERELKSTGAKYVPKWVRKL